MTIRFFDHLDSTGALLAFTLPGDCIDDCSAAGDVQESVRYWVRKLGFDAPEDKTREYLAASGAWDDDELADHEANLERLLWLVCCDEATGGWVLP